MKSRQSVSLLGWQKGLHVKEILISEFVISEIRISSAELVRSGPYYSIHEFRNKDHFCIQAFFARLSGCQDFISKNLCC